MSEIIVGTPDESGWYWFKKDQIITLVLLTSDGIGLTFDPDGYSEELNDLIGEWEIAEPNDL